MALVPDPQADSSGGHTWRHFRYSVRGDAGRHGGGDPRTHGRVDGVGHMPNLMEPECQEALHDALAHADAAHH